MFSIRRKKTSTNHMKIRLLFVLAILSSCKNLEDVSPSGRSTFTYFYGSGINRTGQSAIVSEDGGYVIVGNETSGDVSKIVIIKTDNLGKTVWEKTIEGGSASGVKLLSDGYVIAGDSIKLNPLSSQISELVNTKARIIRMDFTGNIAQDFSYGKTVITSTDTLAIDFSGDAITLNQAGELILLGTFKSPNGYENIFVSAHDPSSLQLKWANQFGLLDKDYINGRSVQIASNGNIVWTTSALKEQQNFNRSYLVVPTVLPNSSFTNSDQYGQLTDQQLFGRDIQLAKSGIPGLGVIGTYATSQGTDADLFYARVSTDGSIDKESIKLFDANSLAENAEEGGQKSEDTGDALAGTSDGGFILAGTMTTTTQRGNGDKDIWLIKVDAFGNVLWNKLLGGSFAETVSSIQETADGGFLICGTHDFSGLSQIMLIRTDKNGDLIN
jgi:hypothetical protein